MCLKCRAIANESNDSKRGKRRKRERITTRCCNISVSSLPLLQTRTHFHGGKLPSFSFSFSFFLSSSILFIRFFLSLSFILYFPFRLPIRTPSFSFLFFFLLHGMTSIHKSGPAFSRIHILHTLNTHTHRQTDRRRRRRRRRKRREGRNTTSLLVWLSVKRMWDERFQSTDWLTDVP